MPQEVPNDLIAVLSEDWHLHPKSEVVYPPLDTGWFREHHPQLAKCIESWQRYAEGRPISDDLGNRHWERRARRAWLGQKYTSTQGPEVATQLKELYYDKNQFRGNRILGVLGTAKFATTYLNSIGEVSLAEKASQITQALEIKIKGSPKAQNGTQTNKPYNELSDVNQKLEVVHFVEASIIQLMGLVNMLKY